MLLELMVENYALVEQAHIRFHEGLNLLTGETGSGKSIVVDSLGLLLGARASADMVRTGAAKALVGGIFCVSESPFRNALLAEAGIELPGDEDLIVEREIGANGKSRASVANRPVTTAFLRQLAPFLGDIHGQGEQQLLFRAEAQRELLDAYAGNGSLVTQAEKVFREREGIRASLDAFDRHAQENLRLLDLWTFQRREIEGAAPRAGEDVELETERRVLANVTRLEASATAAYAALYEAPESVSSQMRLAIKRLDEISRIDDSLAPAAGLLREAEVAVEEAARSLRDYMGRLESDPARLDQVEARLAAIEKLRRKYGGSIPEVLAFLEDVTRRIAQTEHSTEHRTELERSLARLDADYQDVASRLSARRQDAAKRLARQVEGELKALAMGGTRFHIAVDRAVREGAQGLDEIRFLVSANKGEEPKPLEKVASGGEVSRLALALKTALGEAGMRTAGQTLVFDEVDTGVGGAAAAAVGKRLKQLAGTNQVICVTHLAQIAGFADHHYAVSKKQRQNRTVTVVEELDRPSRAREIGRMLSGETVTPEALRQAEQLMQAGAGK